MLVGHFGTHQLKKVVDVGVHLAVEGVHLERTAIQQRLSAGEVYLVVVWRGLGFLDGEGLKKAVQFAHVVSRSIDAVSAVLDELAGRA
jgi:hypothetical protein